jgi:hypothetical protein
LGEVEHLALDHVGHLRNVQDDDVAQLFFCGPHGAAGADVAAADDADLGPLHDWRSSDSGFR